MPSLKDLKIRIESVKSTRKITKAMQMVAAAKLRRAQAAAEAARPYSERMASVLANIANAMDGGEAPAPGWPCTLFDLRYLRRSGAVAGHVGPGGLRWITAKDAAGARVWARQGG